jgi:hypothetical protein
MGGLETLSYMFPGGGNMMIPFVISAYVMQVFFLIGLFAGENFVWANYVGLAFTLLTFVCGIITIIKNVSDDNKDTRKEAMIAKLVLIPYFAINLIVGLMAIFGSLDNIIALPTVVIAVLLFIVISVLLLLLFNYFILVVTSAGNVRYLIKNLVDKKDQTALLHIALHFIFIADIISSIILVVKKDEETT